MIRYEHPDRPPVAEQPDWSNVVADEHEPAVTREIAAEVKGGQHREEH